MNGEIRQSKELLVAQIKALQTVNAGLRSELKKATDLLKAAYPLIPDSLYQPVTKPAIKSFLEPRK